MWVSKAAGDVNIFPSSTKRDCVRLDGDRRVAEVLDGTRGRHIDDGALFRLSLIKGPLKFGFERGFCSIHLRSRGKRRGMHDVGMGDGASRHAHAHS